MVRRLRMLVHRCLPTRRLFGYWRGRIRRPAPVKPEVGEHRDRRTVHFLVVAFANRPCQGEVCVFFFSARALIACAAGSKFGSLGPGRQRITKVGDVKAEAARKWGLRWGSAEPGPSQGLGWVGVTCPSVPCGPCPGRMDPLVLRTDHVPQEAEL